jgi:peptidoglycan/xylan/chitin deacetylase (PgdA/CDA1 family)
MKVLILGKKRLALVFSILLLSLLLIGTLHQVIGVVTKTLKPIYAAKTETNQIAITFDISWGEQNVLPILNILKEEDLHATFFLSSPWAEKQAELVKTIAANGHEIGSHGRRHVDMNTLSESELIKELEISRGVLENLTGQKINLLRPPNGAYDNKVISVANAQV